jgi:hypothetical protein
MILYNIVIEANTLERDTAMNIRHQSMILPEFGGNIDYFYGDNVIHIPSEKTGIVVSFSKRYQEVCIRWDDNTGVASDVSVNDIKLIGE